MSHLNGHGAQPSHLYNDRELKWSPFMFYQIILSICTSLWSGLIHESDIADIAYSLWGFITEGQWQGKKVIHWRRFRCYFFKILITTSTLFTTLWKIMRIILKLLEYLVTLGTLFATLDKLYESWRQWKFVQHIMKFSFIPATETSQVPL